MAVDQLEGLLTKREAANLLGVSLRTLSTATWRAREGLAGYRVGKALKFAPRDVAEYLDRRRERLDGVKGGPS